MCRVYPSSSYYHLNSQYKIFSQNSRIDPESAVLYDTTNLLSSISLNNVLHGLFNDKYPLHIIPHPKKQNVFMNRISYDIRSDSYYENEIFNKKYIEFWDKGALYYENLVYTIYYSDNRTYLGDTMALSPENTDLPSSIIYKFDYSLYETLVISSLNLRLNCYDNNTGYHLTISISTNTYSNNITPNLYLKNLKWNIIKETYVKTTNERINLPKNLTHLVNNKKVFYIKAEILKKQTDHQRNLQLFPYTKNNYDKFSIKKNFGLDVNVELSSISSYALKSALYFNIEYEKRRNTKPNINTLNLGGVFNNKYRFNVLPSEEINIYTHRISYSIITNAYYENGITDIKYLKRWDRGSFTYKNIYYSLEDSMDTETDYLSRTLSIDKKHHPAHITWKFNYRPGDFYINSLKLKLKFHYSSKIQWLIQLLPTRKNPNPEFKPITFPLQKQQKNKLYSFKNLDYILDLTEIVKDEYGFILKAYMNDGKTQLFRQDINRYEKSLLSYLSDDNFDMDIKVELKPNIICQFKQNEMNEEGFIFNDKSTSDFIIKLENIGEDNTFFYVHSKILTSKSDYFQALFNSRMLESQSKFLKLTDIPYVIFEKLLLYIYTDNIENINNIDDWIELLYVSSRLFVTKLVQICELSIRKLVDFDNIEEVTIIARECNAMQLLKYCEMYKPYKKIQEKTPINEKFL